MNSFLLSRGVARWICVSLAGYGVLLGACSSEQGGVQSAAGGATTEGSGAAPAGGAASSSGSSSSGAAPSNTGGAGVAEGTGSTADLGLAGGAPGDGGSSSGFAGEPGTGASSSGGAGSGVETGGTSSNDSGGTGGGSDGNDKPVVFPEDLPEDDGVGHLHHVHVNVLEPSASLEFYTRWFNCERAQLGEEEALWLQTSWVLFQKVVAPAESPIVSSFYHIGWTVPDMDETYDGLVQAGVSFDTPRVDISTVFGGGGGIDFAYVEGPDRELVEFYQSSSEFFNHLHFISDDPVGVGEWYQEHFGAQRDQPSPSREEGFVNDRQIDPWMSVDFDDIEFLWYPRGFAEATYPEDWEGRTELEPQRGRVLDHFALSVDNLPQALERLESEGVAVLEEPAWRMNGAFLSAFVQGPDRIEVEVVQGQAARE